MSDAPELEFKSYSPPGGARMRRLSFSWTAEDVQNFIELHGVGAEVGIAEAVAEEIRREIAVLAERARKRWERLRRYQKKCKKGQRRNRKERAAR
jgi:hypothetical protein